MSPPPLYTLVDSISSLSLSLWLMTFWIGGMDRRVELVHSFDATYSTLLLSSPLVSSHLLHPCDLLLSLQYLYDMWYLIG